MKKSNSSLLSAILGGIITCFVCMGMVFMFSSNETTNLKGNDVVPNQIVETEKNEEPILADVNTSCKTSTEFCSGFTEANEPWDNCRSLTSNGVPQTNCQSSGSMQWILVDGEYACYNIYPKSQGCGTCYAGAYLDDYNCKLCPDGKYCTGGSDAPKDCPAGWTPKADKSGCECNAGYEYNSTSGTCVKCPAGKHKTNAGNTACEACGAGTYQDLEGQKYCKEPDTGYYQDAPGQSTQKRCDGGTVNESKTACIKEVSLNCSNKTYNGSEQVIASCSDASLCHISSVNGSPVDFSSVSKKDVGTYVIVAKTTGGGRFPDGSNQKECTVQIKAACPAGKGLASANATECTDCAAGTYSPDNDDVCHTCTNGYSKKGASKCETGTCCVTSSTGSRTPYDDPIACQQAIKGNPEKVEYGKCPVTENPVVTKITRDYDGSAYLSREAYNSRYGIITITYIAYDQENQVIKGANLKWTVNAPSGVIQATNLNSDGTVKSGNALIVTYKGLGCYNDPVYVNVTATGTSGVSGSATSGTNTIYTNYESWGPAKTFEKENTDNYPILASVHNQDYCIAVSDPYQDLSADGKTTVTKYRYIHNRCCGTPEVTPTPQPTITPAPVITPVPTPKAEYCFIDGNGNYTWTSEPQSSWVKVNGINNKDSCKKEEENACYQNPNGEYVWGKYATKDGYQKITSIGNKDACKKEQPGEACYKNSEDDYKWTSEAPAGYTKVDTAKTPAECAKPEEPACYVHGDDYVWGNYENISGYNKLFIYNPKTGKDEPLPKKDCKVPQDACYLDPEGNYVWGQYESYPQYELVSEMKTEETCVGGKEGVPVPKTASNVSTLVYIFMAIIMASGISFIYYSSIYKREK